MSTSLYESVVEFRKSSGIIGVDSSVTISGGYVTISVVTSGVVTSTAVVTQRSSRMPISTLMSLIQNLNGSLQNLGQTADYYRLCFSVFQSGLLLGRHKQSSTTNVTNQKNGGQPISLFCELGAMKFLLWEIYMVSSIFIN